MHFLKNIEKKMEGKVYVLLFHSSAFLLWLLMTESLPKGSWREFTPFRRVTSPSWVPRLPKNGQEPFNVDLENRHTNKMSKDFSIDYI